MRNEINAYRHIGPNQVAKNAENAHMGPGVCFPQKELRPKTKPKTREAEYSRQGRPQEVTAAGEKELNLETVCTRRKQRLAPGLPRISRLKKPLRKRLNPTELEPVFRGALTEVNLPEAKKAERYPKRGGGADPVERLAPVVVANSGAESSGAEAEAERAGCSRKGSEPPELSAMKAPADTVRKCTPRTNQTASAELCAPVPYPTHGQKLGGKKVLATVPSSTSRSSSGNGVLSTNDMAEFTRVFGGLKLQSCGKKSTWIDRPQAATRWTCPPGKTKEDRYQNPG